MTAHRLFALCLLPLIIVALPRVAGAATVSEICDGVIAETTAKVNPTELQAQAAQLVARGHNGPGEAWGIAGAGFTAANMVEPAMHCLAQATKAGPDNANHLNNLGFLLLDQGAYDDADVVLAEANAKSPDVPEVLANLGKLRWRQGRANDALAFLKQAAEDDSHPEYAYGYAKCLNASGRSAEATEALDASLSRHPSHQDSLDLYREITGQQWQGSARRLAEEALELGEDTCELIDQFARAIDAIAAASGSDQVGGQIATLQRGFSEAFTLNLRTTMDDGFTTNEILAVQALHCYAHHIRSMGGLHHQFYSAIYLWNHEGARPHFQFSPAGAYDWMNDECAYNDLLTKFEESIPRAIEKQSEAVKQANEHERPLTEAQLKAIWCGIVLPPASAYVGGMPAQFSASAAHITRALRDVSAVDETLIARYNDYHARATPLAEMELLKDVCSKHEAATHAFFDPDQQVFHGTRWCADESIGAFRDMMEFHRSRLHNAQGEVDKCAAADAPERQPPDFEDFLRAIAEAQAESGVAGCLTIELEIIAFKAYGDGTLEVVMGQGLQVSGNYNVLSENYGFKGGVGARLSNPGVSAASLDAGTYVVWDSGYGTGVQYTTSVGAGMASVGYTSTAWFSSTF